MPPTSRLQIAKKKIESVFDAEPRKIYSHADLQHILSTHRADWKLAGYTTVKEFISFITKHTRLRACKFRAKTYGRTLIRYTWEPAPTFQLVTSIYPRGYLCHATAMALHGLANLGNSTIYVNVEQSPKYSDPSSLTQESIDRAFAGRQRQSKLIYKYEGISVTILAGKHTGGAGVVQAKTTDAGPVPVTSLERTLIDIAVRPAYAGSIRHVLAAYKAAKDRVSVDKLVSILKELDYVYPYHQSIGFLMQAADYRPADYEPLRQLGLHYDFYLVHHMTNPAFSAEWRIHYPKGLGDPAKRAPSAR
jgi:hypothetical protein